MRNLIIPIYRRCCRKSQQKLLEQIMDTKSGGGGEGGTAEDQAVVINPGHILGGSLEGSLEYLPSQGSIPSSQNATMRQNNNNGLLTSSTTMLKKGVQPPSGLATTAGNTMRLGPQATGYRQSAAGITSATGRAFTNNNNFEDDDDIGEDVDLSDESDKARKAAAAQQKKGTVNYSSTTTTNNFLKTGMTTRGAAAYFRDDSDSAKRKNHNILEADESEEDEDEDEIDYNSQGEARGPKKERVYTVQQLKGMYTRPVLKLKKGLGGGSLSDYKVLGLLGQGGFGQVNLVRALKEEGQALLALKKIMISLNGTQMTEQKRLRVMRETDIMAQIAEHPHIVKLHAHFIDSETDIQYKEVAVMVEVKPPPPPPPQPALQQQSTMLTRQNTNRGGVAAGQTTNRNAGSGVGSTQLQQQKTMLQQTAVQEKPQMVQVMQKVPDQVTERWYLCIVMEHANKGDLLNLIDKYKNAKRHIDESLIWTLCAQVGSGLQYLHSLHVVHRDIKPQNILLTDEKVFKIGDLGISRKMNSKQQTLNESKIGTPLYASPELIRKQPYDYKLDMWALGCVLHYMACLEHPFLTSQVEVKKNHVSRQSIEYQILHSTPKSLPERYSNRLRIVIQRLLEKDPTRRLSASELLQLLPLQEFGIEEPPIMNNQEHLTQELMHPPAIPKREVTSPEKTQLMKTQKKELQQSAKKEGITKLKIEEKTKEVPNDQPPQRIIGKNEAEQSQQSISKVIAIQEIQSKLTTLKPNNLTVPQAQEVKQIANTNLMQQNKATKPQPMKIVEPGPSSSSVADKQPKQQVQQAKTPIEEQQLQSNMKSVSPSKTRPGMPIIPPIIFDSKHQPQAILKIPQQSQDLPPKTNSIKIIPPGTKLPKNIEPVISKEAPRLKQQESNLTADQNANNNQNESIKNQPQQKPSASLQSKAQPPLTNQNQQTIGNQQKQVTAQNAQKLEASSNTKPDQIKPQQKGQEKQQQSYQGEPEMEPELKQIDRNQEQSRTKKYQDDQRNLSTADNNNDARKTNTASNEILIVESAMLGGGSLNIASITTKHNKHSLNKSPGIFSDDESSPQKETKLMDQESFNGSNFKSYMQRRGMGTKIQSQSELKNNNDSKHSVVKDESSMSLLPAPFNEKRHSRGFNHHRGSTEGGQQFLVQGSNNLNSSSSLDQNNTTTPPIVGANRYHDQQRQQKQSNGVTSNSKPPKSNIFLPPMVQNEQSRTFNQLGRNESTGSNPGSMQQQEVAMKSIEIKENVGNQGLSINALLPSGYPHQHYSDNQMSPSNGRPFFNQRSQLFTQPASVSSLNQGQKLLPVAGPSHTLHTSKALQQYKQYNYIASVTPQKTLYQRQIKLSPMEQRPNEENGQRSSSLAIEPFQANQMNVHELKNTASMTSKYQPQTPNENALYKEQMKPSFQTTENFYSTKPTIKNLSSINIVQQSTTLTASNNNNGSHQFQTKSTHHLSQSQQSHSMSPTKVLNQFQAPSQKRDLSIQQAMTPMPEKCEDREFTDYPYKQQFYQTNSLNHHYFSPARINKPRIVVNQPSTTYLQQSLNQDNNPNGEQTNYINKGFSMTTENFNLNPTTSQLLQVPPPRHSSSTLQSDQGKQQHLQSETSIVQFNQSSSSKLTQYHTGGDFVSLEKQLPRQQQRSFNHQGTLIQTASNQIFQNRINHPYSHNFQYLASNSMPHQHHSQQHSQKKSARFTVKDLQ